MENAQLKTGDIIKIKGIVWPFHQPWIDSGDITIDKEYEVLLNDYGLIIEDNVNDHISVSNFIYEIVPPQPKERSAIVTYLSMLKHGSVINSWLSGKDFQFQYSGDAKWHDVDNTMHRFDTDKEYRLKETKSVRVALCNYDFGDYTLASFHKDEDTDIQSNQDFVKWLTDRIEY